MALELFPWENGEIPAFINKEGFEWYVDESLSIRAIREHPLGHPPLSAVCFMIRKDEKFLSRVLMDSETREIVADEPSVEEMATKIDRLRAAKHLKP